MLFPAICGVRACRGTYLGYCLDEYAALRALHYGERESDHQNAQTHRLEELVLLVEVDVVRVVLILRVSLGELRRVHGSRCSGSD